MDGLKTLTASCIYSITRSGKRKADKESSKLSKSQCQNTFPHYHKKTFYRHGVWKSQKKSHSKLRARRATFTFWVDKSSLEMPKMAHFGEFLKAWILRANSVTRQANWKGQKGKRQNWKWDILVNFQTLCVQVSKWYQFSNAILTA